MSSPNGEKPQSSVVPRWPGDEPRGFEHAVARPPPASRRADRSGRSRRRRSGGRPSRARRGSRDARPVRLARELHEEAVDVQPEERGQQLRVVDVGAVGRVLVAARAGVDADLRPFVVGEARRARGCSDRRTRSSRPPRRVELERRRPSVKSIWTVAPAVEAAADVGRGLVDEVVEEGLARVAGDAVGRVEEAERRSRDHGLLERRACVFRGRHRDTTRVASRSGTDPRSGRGSCRVWPSLNGIVTPPGARLVSAGDRVGREARLALLAVGDHGGAGLLEAAERVADGLVEERVEPAAEIRPRRPPACRPGVLGTGGCCRWVRSGVSWAEPR